MQETYREEKRYIIKIFENDGKIFYRVDLEFRTLTPAGIDTIKDTEFN